MANYTNAFGPLSNRKYDMGTHSAIISQQAGTAMQCVRVTDGTDTKAAVTIGSTDITFTALYTGTVGNNIGVTLQAGSKVNTVAAVVTIPGYGSELFNNIPFPTVQTSAVLVTTSASTTVTVASTAGILVGDTITGTGITASPTVASISNSTTIVMSVAETLTSTTVLTFTPASYNSGWVAMALAINNGQSALRGASNWITATSSSGTTAPSLGTTYTLTGGGDGVATITSSVLIGTDTSPAVGMYALRGTGMSILDVCDLDDPTQWTSIDALAISESCYAIQTVPAGTSVTTAVSDKKSSGLDSGYSKLMHGDWLWWNDPVNGVTRLVSPQAFAAGRLSNLTPQNITLNKPIYGIAGSQKSGLAGANQSYYSTADLSTLIQAGIDVITNPGAGGLSIWTCRSGHTSSTNITLQLDNYPTLTNYIAKTLAAGMGFYIGQVITKDLFLNISATLSQFMQNLTGAGLLSAPDGSQPFAVQCNLANNPSSLTKIGVVTATVQAEYPSINQTFIVNLQGGSTVTVSVQNPQG